MKERIIFLDTETTGVGESDRILQIAYAEYELSKKGLKFIKFLEENITPPCKIGPASAAVHGIWYDDLIDAPTFENSQSKKDIERFIKEGVYFSAHNAPFDLGMLEKEGIKYPKELVVDTLKIARHLNRKTEEIESNGLQYLRYFYDFDRMESFKVFLKDYKIEKLMPHTALSDIAVLAFYYKHLIDNKMLKNVEEGVMYTRTPVLEEKIKFGNVFEKGTLFKDALVATYEQYGKRKEGKSYINWALGNMETLSADIRISIAKITIELIQEGKLKVTDKDLAPMLFIGATFDLKSREYLQSIGMNTEHMVLSTMNRIFSEFESMEKSSPKYSVYEQLIEYKEFLN